MIKHCYQVAVTAWQIQPGEFWAMDYEQWWWIADMRRESRKDYYAGTLRKADCDDLYEMLNG